MNENIKEIAQRLKGLREAIDISAKEMAERGSITEEQYKLYESGEMDIPVSVMHQMCKKCGVDISEILAGESQHNTTYTVTPSGKGISVKRTTEYYYQALAYNFKGRLAEPYLVTITADESPKTPTNSHEGQEFNYILEGEVELMLDTKKILLKEGDSVYFNSKIPHGLRVVGTKDVKLLAMLI